MRILNNVLVKAGIIVDNYVAIGTNSPLAGYNIDSRGSHIFGNTSSEVYHYFQSSNVSNGSALTVSANNTSANSGRSQIMVSDTAATVNTRFGIGVYTGATPYAYLDSASRLAINPSSGANVIVGGAVDAGFKLDVIGTGRFTGALNVNHNDTNIAALDVRASARDITLYVDNTRATGTNYAGIFQASGVASNIAGYFNATYGTSNVAIKADYGDVILNNASGTTRVGSLSGTGSRMVIADSSGVLSTQAITTGTVTSVALATGTTGTDVNVSGSPITGSGTITLNIPDASTTARGLVTTGAQTFGGDKNFNNNLQVNGIGFFLNTLNAAYISLTGGAGINFLETGAVSTPNAGRGLLYAKSDKKIYYKNADGTDYDLTAGGSVTSVALATGTSGTDVNVSGSPITGSGTITLNIPDASVNNRGLVTRFAQSFAGDKTFTNNIYIANSGAGSVGMLIDGTSNSAGYIAIKAIGGYSYQTAGYVSLTSSSAGVFTLVFADFTRVANFIGSSLTAARNFTLPNASGTIALTSDIPSLSGYVTGSGTSGNIAYWNGSSSITGESNLYWDATNDRLGIGTSSPGYKIDAVASNGSANIINVINNGGTLYTTSAGFRAEVAGSTMIMRTNYGSGYGSIGMVTNESLGFITNDTLKMYLTAGGNLLVGTVTDSGEKLVVEGKIKLNAVGYGFEHYANSTNSLRTYAGSTYQIIETTNGTTSNQFGYVGGKFYIQTASTDRFLLDASGNLGLSVTPSAWSSSYKAIQIGNSGSIFSAAGTGGDVYISSNAYLSTGGNTYINSNFASDYYQFQGQHIWRTAPSGTAGNAITFTQSMTLDASGNLGVGIASPSNRLHVYGTDGNSYIRWTSDVATTGTRIGYNGTEFRIDQQQNADITFRTNGSEKARITSAGRLLLGTATESTYIFDAVGNGRFTGVLTAGNASNIDNALAVQISSEGAGTQKWIGVNKNGAYGLIIGYNEISAGLSGVGAYIRQVTADPIYFLVNNTTLALTLANTGAATFSSSVTTTQLISLSASGAAALFLKDGIANNKWEIGHSANSLYFYNYTRASNDLILKGSTGQLQLNAYQSTSSFTGTVVGYLAFDSSGNILTTAAPGGSGTVTGSGTTNYLPKWTSGSALGNSALQTDANNNFYINVSTSTNNSPSLYIQSTDAGSGQGNPRLIFARSGEETLRLEAVANVEGRIKAVAANVGSLTFYTGTDTEKMRLTNNGNLLVGTSVDSGEKLVVSGKQRIIDGTEANLNLTSDGAGGDQAAIYVQKGTGNGVVFAEENRDFIWRTGFAALTGGGGTERMRLTNAGNLGLGVAPSAWVAGTKAMEFFSKGNAVLSGASNQILLTTNAYFDGAWKYGTAGFASYYMQTNARHSWHIAPSGTTDGLITFTQAMTLDASGNLMVGKTTQSGNAALTVKSLAGGNTGIILIEGDMANDGWGMYAVTGDEYRITRFTNGSYSDKLVITSSGNVLIGNNPIDAGYKLDVAGNGRFVNAADQITIKTASTTGTRIGHDTSGLYLANDDTSLSVLRIFGGTSGTEKFSIAASGVATFSSSVYGSQFKTPGFVEPTSVIGLFNNTNYSGPSWNAASLVTGNGATGVIMGGDAGLYAYGWIQGIQTDTGGVKGLFLNPLGGAVTVGGATTFNSSVTANDSISVVKSKSGTGIESYNLLSLRVAGTGAIGDSGNIAWRSNDGSYTIASIGGISGADNVAYGSIAFSTRNYFTDSLVEVMRINNRGNVGIGTSSPLTTLTVKSTNDNGYALTRPSDGSTYHWRLSTSETGTDPYTVKYNTFNNDMIFISYLAGGTGGNIKFRTGASGSGSESDRVTIKNNGQLQLINYQTTTSFSGTVVGYLAFDASGNILTTAAPGGTVTGSGTTNYIPKFTGANSIGNTNLITDSSGNLGYGSTPSVWSHGRGIDVGTNAAFYGDGATGFIAGVAQNAYRTNVGTWAYKQNAGAGRFEINANNFYWYLSGAGVAGNTISFSEVMSLDNSGNLLLRQSGSSNYLGFLTSAGSTVHRITFNNSDNSLTIGGGTVTAYPINFNLGTSTKMTLLSTGQLRIHNYTSTSSFTGTAAGYLGFDSSGNIITTSGGGGGTPAGSNGQIQFNSSGAFGADSNFFWDNTNKRLGIGTASPATALQVAADGIGSVGTIGIKGSSGHLGIQAASGTFKGWYGYFNSSIHGSDVDLNIKTGYAGSSNIRFGINGDSGEAMRITSNGRLLLGTQTEGTWLLDVNGNARVNGDFAGFGNGIFGNNVGGSVITDFTVNGGSSAYPNIRLTTGGSLQSQIQSFGGAMYLQTNGSTTALTLASDQAATFSSTLRANGPFIVPSTSYFIGNATFGYRFNNAADTLNLLVLADSGAATFISSVTATAVSLTSTTPINLFGNGNNATFTQTTIYANVNNTSGDLSNGIFIERGRLTDSGSAEIRNFVIGSRGGQSQFVFKGDGQLRLNNYQTTTSFTGTVVGNLGFDASGNILTTGIAVTGSGSGSTNEGYMTRWNGTTSVTQSQIYEQGGLINVGWDGASINMIVTGKIYNTRIDPRSITTTSATTLTPDVSLDDFFTVTAQAATITLANPTGTPVEGQKIIIRIKDNGTARSIQYGTQYRASSDYALPTTTTVSKTLYLGFIYNSTDTKWDLLSKLDNFT